MKTHQKPTTLWNKLIAILIVILCVVGVLIDGDLTATIIMTPIALVLFFTKKPVIGQREDDDYPWGGKK